MSLCSKRRGEGGGSTVGRPQKFSDSLGWGWAWGRLRARGAAASPELYEEAPGDWGGGGSRS